MVSRMIVTVTQPVTGDHMTGDVDPRKFGSRWQIIQQQSFGNSLHRCYWMAIQSNAYRNTQLL